MKNCLAQLMKVASLLLLMLTFCSVNAQDNMPASTPVKNPPVDGSLIKMYIDNTTLVNDKTLEFDIYIKDLGSSSDKPFELSLIQPGVLVNCDILNGGDITSLIVPDISDLAKPQQPTTTIFVKGREKAPCSIKIASKNLPGPGNGTIIKRSGKGTKVCRVRLTNTVSFAKAKANLTFCFTKLPFPTKIFKYIEKISTQVKTDATNCFGDKSNPLLNK